MRTVLPWNYSSVLPISVRIPTTVEFNHTRVCCLQADFLKKQNKTACYYWTVLEHTLWSQDLPCTPWDSYQRLCCPPGQDNAEVMRKPIVTFITQMLSPPSLYCWVFAWSRVCDLHSESLMYSSVNELCCDNLDLPHRGVVRPSWLPAKQVDERC